jgi:hypothetical protein
VATTAILFNMNSSSLFGVTTLWVKSSNGRPCNWLTQAR